MARIKPFRATYFNPQIAGDISRLVSPPYDVISPEEARALRAGSLHNTIHIELGEPGDADFYRKAAELILAWQRQGVLKSADRPAIYFYQTEFSYHMAGRDRKVRRRGFFALLGVSDYEQGEVLRHEHTLSGPKQDRLQLLRATRTNISPIFVLYKDPGLGLVKGLARAKQVEPVFELTDDKGVSHKLFGVDDPKVVEKVAAELAKKPVYIADGHHRYETALNFGKELAAARDPMAASAAWVMTYFCPVEDPGLVILPYHRLVRNMPADRIAGFMERVRMNFQTELIADRFSRRNTAEVFQALDASGKSRALVMIDDSRKAWMLKLKRGLAKDFKAKLDVEILKELVLEQGLRISRQEITDKNHVAYETKEELILKRLSSEDFQFAFLLRPLAVDKVIARADAGGVMPQKSTYFYPKLPSGLVFRKMVPGRDIS